MKEERIVDAVTAAEERIHVLRSEADALRALVDRVQNGSSHVAALEELVAANR